MNFNVIFVLIGLVGFILLLLAFCNRHEDDYPGSIFGIFGGLFLLIAIGAPIGTNSVKLYEVYEGVESVMVSVSREELDELVPTYLKKECKSVGATLLDSEIMESKGDTYTTYTIDTKVNMEYLGGLFYSNFDMSYDVLCEQNEDGTFTALPPKESPRKKSIR